MANHRLEISGLNQHQTLIALSISNGDKKSLTEILKGELTPDENHVTKACQTAQCNGAVIIVPNSMIVWPSSKTGKVKINTLELKNYLLKNTHHGPFTELYADGVHLNNIGKPDSARLPIYPEKTNASHRKITCTTTYSLVYSANGTIIFVKNR